MASVEIRNLGKCHPQPKGPGAWTLRHVTLTVSDGEYFVLVGPSGAGKSTLLRLVAGLDEPSEGEVILDGRRLAGVDASDRDVGMVFQNHALYPHLTAFENMALGLRLRKIPRVKIENLVRETAAMLGIEACLQRRPAGLSNGERQRVALGRALARRPKLLLLDEPYCSLDAPCRARAREEVLRLHQRLGLTTFHVTHDQAEALSLGHRMAVLQAGSIRQVGDPESLCHDPADLFVAGFMGSPPMNLIPGSVIMRDHELCFQAEGEAGSDRLCVRLTSAPLADLWPSAKSPLPPPRPILGQAVVCGIRAEHLHWSSSGPGAQFENLAVVERAERVGAAIHLHVRAAGHALVAVAAAKDCPKPGLRIGLRFEPDRVRLFDRATGQRMPA